MGDAFEAEVMHDGARIVCRDKKVTRKMAGILFVPAVISFVVAVFTIVGNVVAERPAPPDVTAIVVASMLGMTALYMFLALAFAVIRTLVTEKAVHVRYGLWGPTISLESIVSCRVVDYDWTKYGGWGIRRAWDGSRAYVAESGPVLELRYRERDVERVVLVGAQDPPALMDGIERARLGSGGTRVAEVETHGEVHEEHEEHDDEHEEHDEHEDRRGR